MILQLSSGQGPAECELAVAKLYLALKQEYPDIELLSGHKSGLEEGYTSVIISTEFDLSSLEGSVQWICRSPYRPEHKRKNWFVDVSVLKADQITYSFRKEDLKFERFHCGGKGGQNVNKVETGVRLIHVPTGISVTSTSERSQYRNKQDAMEKLAAIFLQKEEEAGKKQVKDAWREHNLIVRGNPVRVYEGMNFRRKIKKQN